jgi:probable HAF family extracellular repeat protein
MKTAARRRFASLLIGVGMALGPTTAAVAQSGYEAPINLTPGPLFVDIWRPLAVNNSGQAVGWYAPGPINASPETGAFSWTPTGGLVAIGRVSRFQYNMASGQVVGSIADHAFLWTLPTGIVDLGTLGGTTSAATAINASGQITGWSEIDGTRQKHVFLWTAAGGMRDLGTLGGGDIEPRAVNDTGRVVGWSTLFLRGVHHAFSWTASEGMVDLGTLGGANSEAMAVNGTDRVVGWSEVVIGDDAVHAFSWTPTGGMVDLGTLGGVSSKANAVSATGQIVGSSEIAIGDDTVHAFSWTPTGGMLDLGTLGGRNSVAIAVNTTGRVVGGSAAIGGAHAFSWTAEEGMVDLGTLAQGSESFATALNERGDVVGGSTLKATPPPYPEYYPAFKATMWLRQQPDDWTFCAPEGGLCAFTGTTEVRYGANGTYVYQTFTDGTACNNAVFGDPLYGTRKSCAIRILPAPTEWTLCAAEGGQCPFSGTREVRYGADGVYVYQTLTDGTACSNDVFGDPIYGTAKACAVRIPPDPTEWTFCATEGSVCAFTGTAEVRYGANGAYIYQTLLDGTACTNSVFGDPAFGTVKSCAVRLSDWTFCASEGDVSAFPCTTKEVRYGASGSYFYKTLSDGTACTNSVFGDPVYGTPKHCDTRAGRAITDQHEFNPRQR